MMAIRWVRLSRYCELSGETEHSVEHKRRTGLWRDGEHWKVAGDGKIWIDLEAVERWVKTSDMQFRQGRPQAARNGRNGTETEITHRH